MIPDCVPTMNGNRPGPVVAAAAFLGMGLGGFVDSIVLHQILQWHQMISARLPPDTLVAAKTNMFWEGVFHAGAWVLTLVGVVLLWRVAGRTDVRFSNLLLIGGLILGWGAFNTMDSVFNHYLCVTTSTEKHSPCQISQGVNAGKARGLR